jgi:lipoprotein-anchoring transpeptidase ErfK/SrfK
MRAFLLVLVGVLALGLVVKFYPSSAVDAGAGEEVDPAPTEEPRFLGPRATTEAADQPPRTLERGDPSAEAAPTPSADEADGAAEGAPGFAGPLPFAQGVVSPSELSVAAALFHDGVDGVEAAIAAAGDQLPDARARLARAYAAALAGERARASTLAEGLADADGVSAAEHGQLVALLKGGAPAARAATAGSGGALLLAVELALLERVADAALEAGRFQEAAEALSQLLQGELDAAWRADRVRLLAWSDGLREAQSHHRWNKRGPWASETVEVRDGDSLTAIRKRYVTAHPDRNLCVGLIRRSNGIQGNNIHPGQALRIPTEPVDVLVDLEARWLLYRIGGEVVEAWEVAIGRPGEETLVGAFVAGDKIVEPPWARAGYEIVPYGDPENPLGTRWISWLSGSSKTSYGFHGTWEPQTIGQAVSDGCIRLRNEDVEQLFEILPVGSPILVRE